MIRTSLVAAAFALLVAACQSATLPAVTSAPLSAPSPAASAVSPIPTSTATRAAVDYAALAPDSVGIRRHSTIASNVYPPLDVRVSDAGKAKALLELVAHLDAFPPGARSCPIDLGLVYGITWYERGDVIAAAAARGQGCQEVALGSSVALRSTPALWEALGTLVGVPAADLRLLPAAVDPLPELFSSPLVAGSSLFAVFPRHAGSQDCLIRGGGPPPGLAIPGTCTTEVRAIKSGHTVAFAQAWDAARFHLAGEPSTGVLRTTWTFVVTADGNVTLDAMSGSFPPQSAR